MHGTCDCACTSCHPLFMPWFMRESCLLTSKQLIHLWFLPKGSVPTFTKHRGPGRWRCREGSRKKCRAVDASAPKQDGISKGRYVGARVTIGMDFVVHARVRAVRIYV